MIMKALLCLLLLCFSVSLSAAEKAVQTVPSVDLKRYIGKWYEIARYPNRFQKDCAGSVSATYTLREDGKVGVLNECRKKSGEMMSANGRAKIADKNTNAKLLVSFFWPFYGDYWILDLGPSYEYAVVGEPRRKYLWILSRTPVMDEGTFRIVLERLTKQGYDISKLQKTPL